MQAFHPHTIFIESAIASEPLVAKVQKHFPHVATQFIASVRELKAPAPMTEAKRSLILAQHRGVVLKPFPKIAHALNLGDYVFNPISNCHLECSYCILQSYLKNNPSITLFANWDDILAEIAAFLRNNSQRDFRIGTGELSDSLALDTITEWSRSVVPFFAQQENAFLELKTKSNAVENLLELDHQGRTVLSFSLSPEEILRKEELKCASLSERLAAARMLQTKGYPVGIHLDPMIYFSGWKKAYDELITQLTQTLDPRRIAWMSIGSLRFDRELKLIASQRFPKSKIFSEDFVSTPEGKFRYFKDIRLQLYRHVWQALAAWSDDFPRYLCMEADWVWEKVTGVAAPASVELENTMLQRLRRLRQHS